ncbi:diguanylate cyclase domain-containing protein [Allgaiera indica]|uniref:diguanylate cyclase n=1 Tax=Allgaiera indica TaxID=765699 RepID=A0A1H2T5E8_9RHOB|nr:diguanylate cyclase [Allgaiera indica]SDW39173.1 response regulator receiver modulated diguanylate cyclase [Allgaiera indica]
MSGSILIVDGVATSRIVMKARLGQAFYSILQAVDGGAGLKLARSERPDVVLIDHSLPDMDGTEFCARLRSDPETATLPVVMLGAKGHPEDRLAALEAGADDYLTRPLNEALLLARLRSLVRAGEIEAELQLRDDTCRELGFAESAAGPEKPARVALVADAQDDGVVWRTALAAQLDTAVDLLPRADVLSEVPGRPVADVFVLAIGASVGPGLGSVAGALDVMSELRSRAATRHAAILVLLPRGGPAAAAIALDLGAGDVVTGPFDPREIALRLGHLIARKRRLERLRACVSQGLRLAVTDPLTGLYNRRYALPHLARIAERADSSGRRFAVMVLDLDRFKRINDTWGHSAGDEVLVRVAERLARNLRAGDLLARIGGEEFLVVLPDADLPTAQQLAERLCRLIEAAPAVLPNGAEITVTLSIGLAIGDPTQPGGTDGRSLLDRADHALLAAKAEGRNQVTIDRPAA